MRVIFGQPPPRVVAAVPDGWDAPVPTPRWLCLIDGGTCPRQGQAIYGPPVVEGLCQNRPVRCLTCGHFGEESTRLDLLAATEASA